MNPSNGSWSEYRKWRNLSWLALVGYMPIVLGVGLASIRLLIRLLPLLYWPSHGWCS